MARYKGYLAFLLVLLLVLMVLIFMLNIFLLLIPVVIIGAIISWLLSFLWKRKPKKPVVEVYVKKF